MKKFNLEEAAFVAAFLPAYAINATADKVIKTKKAVVNKIDEARCELHNRRHFDKKHPHLAPKK